MDTEIKRPTNTEQRNRVDFIHFPWYTGRAADDEVEFHFSFVSASTNGNQSEIRARSIRPILGNEFSIWEPVYWDPIIQSTKIFERRSTLVDIAVPR
mmetsp:Transcript_25867/g.49750  ORF Transcript_25867/g.49750 Transcript_25867/m.49750 type:complete len:97 (-) Transcript_25867:697-987(-)